MNRVLWLVLMNLGARWTTKLAQGASSYVQTLFKVVNFDLEGTGFRATATASDLADARRLQSIEQGLFHLVTTSERKVGVLENDL